MDNREPYIYKTTDFGATWTKITGDLPTAHPLDYVAVGRREPEQEGHAVRRHRPRASTTRWTTARTGRSSRTGCRTRRSAGSSSRSACHDVVVSTYGRGLYILRDITPLEQARSDSADDADVHVYAPRPGVPPGAQRAARTFTVHAAKAAPGGPVRVEILDRRTAAWCARSTIAGARRAEPRDLGSALRRADVGRAAHDAAGQPAHLGGAALPRTRTRGRSRTGAFSSRRRGGPIAAPGKYTVRLTVDGTDAHAAVRDPEGSGDRSVATPTSRRRRRCRSAFATT